MGWVMAPNVAGGVAWFCQGSLMKRPPSAKSAIYLTWVNPWAIANLISSVTFRRPSFCIMRLR